MKYRLLRSTFAKDAARDSYLLRWRGYKVWLPKSQVKFKKKVGYRLLLVPEWLYEANKEKIDWMENVEVSRSFNAKGLS